MKRGSLFVPHKVEQRQRSTLLECASISHSTQHGDKAIVHIREKEEEEEKKQTILRRGQSLLRLRFHLQVRYILFLSVSADGENGFGSREGRTTHIVNQLLRDEIRKLDMLVKKARCPAEN